MKHYREQRDNAVFCWTHEDTCILPKHPIVCLLCPGPSTFTTALVPLPGPEPCLLFISGLNCVCFTGSVFWGSNSPGRFSSADACQLGQSLFTSWNFAKNHDVSCKTPVSSPQNFTFLCSAEDLEPTSYRTYFLCSTFWNASVSVSFWRHQRSLLLVMFYCLSHLWLTYLSFIPSILSST